MNSLKKLAGAAAVACALTVAPFAHAGLVTFDIKWASAGGVDAAFAELTLDSTLIDTAPLSPRTIDISRIDNLKLTVSGASVGNGVFSKQDFSSILFYTAAPLDFRRNLIGQRVVVGSDPRNDTTYGDADGISGGFAFFANQMTTPSGLRPFALITDRTAENSDFLTVSSIVARDAVSAVPEPTTYAMLMAGLALVAARARRKSRR